MSSYSTRVARCAPGKSVTVVSRGQAVSLPEVPPVIPVSVDHAKVMDELREAVRKLTETQEKVVTGLERLASQEREVVFPDGETVISRPVKGV